mgnify:CR=1 FL=1
MFEKKANNCFKKIRKKRNFFEKKNTERKTNMSRTLLAFLVENTILKIKKNLFLGKNK